MQREDKNTPAPRTHVMVGNGYAEAFYELAKLFDIGAQDKSPKDVWESQMLPRIRALISPPDHVAGGDDITERAIAIIVDEAEEMGYTDTTLAEFRAGEFDGDDRLTLQAVERALEASQSPRSKDCTSTAAQKLKLWFFRDISDDQRLKLFSLFGLPVDEIGKIHGIQSHALRRVIRTLASTEGAEG